MDSASVSEAGDVGSIPAGSTSLRGKGDFIEQISYKLYRKRKLKAVFF